MKLKLKTATLMVAIVSAIYSLMLIVNMIEYADLKFYDLSATIETLIQLFFPISLTVFFYTLYQNQK